MCCVQSLPLDCCDSPLHCASIRPDSPHKGTSATYRTGKRIHCLYLHLFSVPSMPNFKITKNKLWIAHMKKSSRKHFEICDVIMTSEIFRSLPVRWSLWMLKTTWWVLGEFDWTTVLFQRPRGVNYHLDLGLSRHAVWRAKPRNVYVGSQIELSWWIIGILRLSLLVFGWTSYASFRLQIVIIWKTSGRETSEKTK